MFAEEASKTGRVDAGAETLRGRYEGRGSGWAHHQLAKDMGSGHDSRKYVELMVG